MHATLHYILELLRKPEWVAAFALLIQAIILYLQARILRKHGKTMEEHADIAKAQATTAELIGKALDQQANVLAEQSKLTDVQFRFQRRIETHINRVKLYEALLDVGMTIEMLIQTGSQNPRDVEGERIVHEKLLKSTYACQRLLLTTIHLTDDEKIYFGDYLTEVAQVLKQRNDKTTLLDIVAFAQFQQKHDDFFEMMSRLSRTPDSILG